MITINTSPAANRIILDGNNTTISVTSTNGAGHYFRALIFIDGALFDTQSWSRKNAYTAEKNFKKLYNAYFATAFNPTFTAGITEQTSLKKQVNITIQELLMADDSVVDTLSLPTFFILYNSKPVTFVDTVKAAFLGITADKIIIPANGKISIPFYTNASAETVVVELKDNFNTVINTVTIPSATAKKVFVYNYDLSAAAPLVNNTIYFILTITVGATTITKPFRYIEYPDFQIKEIAYLNTFGFFVYAYLDGQMSIDNSLSIETYEQLNGSDKIIEINEDLTYTINSGSLLSSEKAIMNEIVNALEAKLFFNGEWIDMVGRTKKVKEYQERLNNYSENLQFSVSRNLDIENTWSDEAGEESEVPTDSSAPPVSSEAPISSTPPSESSAPPTESSEPPPTESRIVLDSVAVSTTGVFPPEGQFCVDVAMTLLEGYLPDDVILVITPDGGSPTESTFAVAFPIKFCSFVPGDYSLYIEEVGTGLFSNTIFFTIP